MGGEVEVHASPWAGRVEAAQTAAAVISANRAGAGSGLDEAVVAGAL
jgi:hypothetical protein